MNARRVETSYNALFWLAILASGILSFWFAYRDDIINPDAICYLSSAEAIGRLGLKGAMHLCAQAQWPFYSALVYGVVQATHFSYAVAGYLLNGVFSAISTASFIFICKDLGGNRRVLWIAFFVILSSHTFNSVREYIIRDHGFWAFYLLSVLAFIRFDREPGWFHALAFSLSLSVATLFRIEGALFLLILPLMVWVVPSTSIGTRLKSFLQLEAVPLLASVGIVVWLLLHPEKSLSELGRLQELPKQLWHGVATMIDQFNAAKTVLAQSILKEDAIRQSGLVMSLLLSVWYLVYVAENLTWVYVLLFIGGFFVARQRMNAEKRVLTAYLILNIIITFGFLLERYFLSKRYLIGLSLIMMLYVPFVIDYLMTRRQIFKYRLFLYVTLLSMGFYFLHGFFVSGSSKTYIAEAGEWMQKNISSNASLYVNDYQLMYYSQHFGDQLFTLFPIYQQKNMLATNDWKQFDYLAFRFTQKQLANRQALMQNISIQPIKIYHNKRGDEVIIYQIPHEEKAT